MLSARGEPLDRILGLELGADDYLPKPCEPRELTARLKAILRRSSNHNTATPSHIELGDLNFSPVRGVVTINEVETVLTVSESRLLEALIKQPGEPIDKHELTQIALGRKLTLYDRSLDMHISNLRKNLALTLMEALVYYHYVVVAIITPLNSAKIFTFSLHTTDCT